MLLENVDVGINSSASYKDIVLSVKLLLCFLNYFLGSFLVVLALHFKAVLLIAFFAETSLVLRRTVAFGFLSAKLRSPQPLLVD